MNRRTVAGLLFLVIAVAVVVLIFLVDRQQTHTEARLSRESEIGQHAYEKAFYDLSIRLRDAAWEAANGEILVYLRGLHAYQNQIAALEKEVAAQFPPDKFPLRHPESQKAREAFVEAHPDLLDSAQFTQLLASSLETYEGKRLWRRIPRSRFVEEEGARLRKCAAVGLDQCMHWFTLPPLEAARDWLSMSHSPGLKIDMIRVFDHNGVGRSDAFDSKWTNDTTLRDSVKLVAAVQDGQAHWDVINLKGRPFLAWAVPILDDTTFLGTIVLGSEIDTQLAKDFKDTLGLDVTFWYRTDVAASTLEPGDVAHLMANYDYNRTVAFDQAQATGQSGQTAWSVPLLRRLENGQTFDTGVRTVLSRMIEGQLTPFFLIKLLVVAFGVLVFLIALLLIHLALAANCRPFEKIEAGIHEIIAGHHDYQLVVDAREALPNTLAQSLNLMVSVLTGRPRSLTAASDTMEWPADLLQDTGADNEDAEILGEVEDAQESDPEADRLDKEPAETYHRRLYNEYLEARKATGRHVDGLPYISFVEKLAFSERQLRERYKCKRLRFRIVQRDGKVILQPVPIRQA